MDDLLIRPYRPCDETALIALWRSCGLVVPWNDPKKDIVVLSRRLEDDGA